MRHFSLEFGVLVSATEYKMSKFRTANPNHKFLNIFRDFLNTFIAESVYRRHRSLTERNKRVDKHF